MAEKKKQAASAPDPVVDSLDDVDERYKDNYRLIDETDHPASGRYMFVMNNKDGFELAHVQGLKDTLSDNIARHKKKDEKLASVKDIDAVKYKDTLEQNDVMRKQIDALKNDKSSVDDKTETRLKLQAEEYEGTIKQLKERSAEEQKALTDKNGQLDSLLRKSDGENYILTNLAQHVKSPEVMLPHVLKRLKTEYPDGEMTRQFLRADGQPLVPDSTGRPAVFEDLMKDMGKEKTFVDQFLGLNKDGGGSKTTIRGAVANGPNPYAKRELQFNEANGNGTIQSNRSVAIESERELTDAQRTL